VPQSFATCVVALALSAVSIAGTGDPDDSPAGDDAIDQAAQEVQRPPIERIEPRRPVPAAAAEMATRLYGPSEVTRRFLAQERIERATRPGANVVVGAESKVRPATDVGNLLGKSHATFGVGVQKRTPIVTDTRTRGNRAGQLLASGSYWVPARMDLDTLLSKIDASALGDIIVVKGPYSARYGPGLSFADFQLLTAPRYLDGPQWHGSTGLNYQTNGQQWSGRQTIAGGSDDWGARLGYTHRTGNDYDSGDGTSMPASYKSREFDSSIGVDLSADSHVEFSYLRLDQTDVEFPGQIFDMDFLVTDGFEVEYVLENQPHFDRLTLDTWYNRTRFEGNAQRSGKREQIPELDTLLTFTGFTDVDSMSSGFRLAGEWGQPDCPQLTAGVDLRYLEQELNEIDTFEVTPGFFLTDNFPIPRSHWSNPGLFVEEVLPLTDRLTLRAGSRVDWVSTNIEGTPAGRTRAELEGILGTDGFDKDFDLWSAYVTSDYQICPHLTAVVGFGHGERPPTLTELYAVAPFLAILQQGFSSVVGNPDLDPESLWQIDVGMKADCGRFRGGASGFYAWVHDYITYRAFSFAFNEPTALAVQFVNTDLATLSGGEVYGEYDMNEWLTSFGTLSYVEGRDHSRGNRGVVLNDPGGVPVPGVSALGSSEEPLPGIAPLESRLGVRLHEPGPQPRWGIELAARIVDNQDRVASSLIERTTPGFTVFDARGYWHVAGDLLLVGGVENLTDKDYHEHLDLRTGTGVRQPGVNFYTGVEWRY